MKICPICGKELKHQGALNLHKWSCTLKNGAQQPDKIAVEKLDDTTIRVETCSHEFRFLNVLQPLENNAYKAGYKEVCSKCQQLH